MQPVATQAIHVSSQDGLFVASEGRAVTPVEIAANRFDLVSRIADDLAHEIKNPLHSMVINLELVKRRAAAGDGDGVVQRAEVVSADIMRVNELVDRLLQLLRPARQGDPVADVDRVVGDLLPLLSQQARLSRVELVYEEIGAPVAAPIRRDALKLVLLNLVARALEHVRASGGRVEISASQSDDDLRLVVVGIGPGSLPGANVVAGSSGEAAWELGRAVAGHLVHAAGGELEEGSAPPGESRWTVRFPRRMTA